MKTIVVALIIISVMIIGVVSVSFAAGSRHLTYNEFIRQVEGGKIKSVTLDKRASISGTLAVGNTTSTFRSYTPIASANDPLLTRFLREHDVTVSMRDVTERRPLMRTLTKLIFLVKPLIFFILLIVIIMKLNEVLKNQRSDQQMNGTN
ncbi:MAG: hypothetical protein GXO98_08205 [Nitrospirae bacterium]|nr:hypothetical protein [Nitrospirota bacterium]